MTLRSVPNSIMSRIGAGLHNDPAHPLCIIKEMIYDRFAGFAKYDDLSPIVSVEQNFDSLLIPKDHPARSDSDTYYITEDVLLRTHTSAHQANLLGNGHDRFLVTGDVFRRDEVDAKHYPIFHQMEGVKVSTYFPDGDLLYVLDSLVRSIFPKDTPFQVEKSQFPFTNPSWEYEVLWGGNWIEILGCGVIQPKIMQNAHRGNQKAWAFGLGLERLAMILFGIPDIRLFWSTDHRFLEQFSPGKVTKFVPFSNQPPCIKDIAFWISDDFQPNDFFAVVRESSGDLVEETKLLDLFTSKSGVTSHCYRLVFRSPERTLTNEEINEIMLVIREKTAALGVTLR